MKPPTDIKAGSEMTTETVGDLHIDDFCRDTAKILLALYRRFPTKAALYVEDISGPDTPDEFGLHSPRFEACFSTLVWLQECDYISYRSEIRQEAVEQAVLTHRAFSALAAFESPPGSPDFSPTRRIDQLKQVLKSGSSEDLKTLVLAFMEASRNYQ